MNKNHFSNNTVLIFGQVLYEDMTAVVGAVVLLEKIIFFCDASQAYMVKSKNKVIEFTQTNEKGEFSFVIYDLGYYYKIKVFENEKINNTTRGKIIINI